MVKILYLVAFVVMLAEIVGAGYPVADDDAMCLEIHVNRLVCEALTAHARREGKDRKDFKKEAKKVCRTYEKLNGARVKFVRKHNMYGRGYQSLSEECHPNIIWQAENIYGPSAVQNAINEVTFVPSD